VEKLLSGGGIKLTKGAWQVPKWLAFEASPLLVLIPIDIINLGGWF
jgi:hypothetical protein